MLVFGIDWLFLTGLLLFIFFGLLPSYLLRIINTELKRLRPRLLLAKLADMQVASDMASKLFLQQIIIQHIDTLLHKKFAWLSSLIPSSLKIDLASQVVDNLTSKMPWLFSDEPRDRVANAQPFVKNMLIIFWREHRWQIIGWSIMGGLIGSILHLLAIYLARVLV